MTDEIAMLVGAPSRDIEAMAVSQGMATLREDGVRLAATGITTLEEIRRVAGETLTEVGGTPLTTEDYGDSLRAPCLRSS